VAGEPVGAQGPRPQPRRGDNRLEPQLRDTGEHLELETQVGVRPEAQEGGDTFRVVEAEPEPNERTEVVGDQPDPPKPERVEQREHVSVGCARPDAAGPRGASGVSVTTPLYYIRTGQFTTRDLRRGPRFIMDRHPLRRGRVATRGSYRDAERTG